MTEIQTQVSDLRISSFRNISDQRAYNTYRHQKREAGDISCDLCDRSTNPKIDRGLLEIIEKDFDLFPNDFPYEHYDTFKVIQHDLFVPKEHVSDMRDLSQDAKLAYSEALFYMEAMKLYNLRIKRAPSNVASSIPEHAHEQMFNIDPMQKVIQHTYCSECQTTHTTFTGQAHIPHV